jgi:hypothetical protein
MPVWVARALFFARRIPWARVWTAILWLRTSGRKYWDRLTPGERKEVLNLMRKSMGRRSNLSKRELDRLMELFRKIIRGEDKPSF